LVCRRTAARPGRPRATIPYPLARRTELGCAVDVSPIEWLQVSGTVIGAGAWLCAVTLYLARRGHPRKLTLPWGRRGA
jgi:hypothetical protein